MASPPVDTVLPAVMTSSPHINSSNFVYPASAAAAVASSGSVGANQGAIAAQTTTAGNLRDDNPCPLKGYRKCLFYYSCEAVS